jgi:uncharacterized protein YjiS (DUF1127 family)
MDRDMAHIGTGVAHDRKGMATRLFVLLGNAFALTQHWADRHAQRRHLRDLNDDQLRDIGISRAKARAEAVRFFWD